MNRFPEHSVDDNVGQGLQRQSDLTLVLEKPFPNQQTPLSDELDSLNVEKLKRSPKRQTSCREKTSGKPPDLRKSLNSPKKKKSTPDDIQSTITADSLDLGAKKIEKSRRKRLPQASRTRATHRENRRPIRRNSSRKRFSIDTAASSKQSSNESSCTPSSSSSESGSGRTTPRTPRQRRAKMASTSPRRHSGPRHLLNSPKHQKSQARKSDIKPSFANFDDASFEERTVDSNGFSVFDSPETTYWRREKAQDIAKHIKSPNASRHSKFPTSAPHPISSSKSPHSSFSSKAPHSSFASKSPHSSVSTKELSFTSSFSDSFTDLASSSFARDFAVVKDPGDAFAKAFADEFVSDFPTSLDNVLELSKVKHASSAISVVADDAKTPSHPERQRAKLFCELEAKGKRMESARPRIVYRERPNSLFKELKAKSKRTRDERPRLPISSRERSKLFEELEARVGCEGPRPPTPPRPRRALPISTPRRKATKLQAALQPEIAFPTEVTEGEDIFGRSVKDLNAFEDASTNATMNESFSDLITWKRSA